MVPIKTSIDDIQKVLGYMARQVGWVEMTKVEKALGGTDDRKIGAMVEFGLLLRDGGNIKVAPRGLTFNGGDQSKAMREVLADVELYRSTLEWVHYQAKSEITATEVGQYWESSHSDTLGNLRGSTLKDGAVTFGRVVEGAGLGTFTIGRGGKETRVSFNLAEVERLIDGASAPTEGAVEGSSAATAVATPAAPVSTPTASAATPAEAQPTAPVSTPVTPAATYTGAQPSVTVSTNPSVHVNVEIHIAADATADTVREIFRNMARYVLDKHVEDDDN